MTNNSYFTMIKYIEGATLYVCLEIYCGCQSKRVGCSSTPRPEVYRLTPTVTVPGDWGTPMTKRSDDNEAEELNGRL